MKEEIGAPCGFAVPPTLELVAGRFLESRQLPGDLFDALLNRVDEWLEREEAAVARQAHENVTSRSSFRSLGPISFRLTPLPRAV